MVFFIQFQLYNRAHSHIAFIQTEFERITLHMAIYRKKSNTDYYLNTGLVKVQRPFICYFSKNFSHPFHCTSKLLIEEFLTDTHFSISYLRLKWYSKPWKIGVFCYINIWKYIVSHKEFKKNYNLVGVLERKLYKEYIHKLKSWLFLNQHYIYVYWGYSTKILQWDKM